MKTYTRAVIVLPRNRNLRFTEVRSHFDVIRHYRSVIEGWLVRCWPDMISYLQSDELSGV